MVVPHFSESKPTMPFFVYVGAKHLAQQIFIAPKKETTQRQNLLGLRTTENTKKSDVCKRQKDKLFK